jgi:hypothetical protein
MPSVTKSPALRKVGGFFWVGPVDSIQATRYAPGAPYSLMQRGAISQALIIVLAAAILARISLAVPPQSLPRDDIARELADREAALGLVVQHGDELGAIANVGRAKARSAVPTETFREAPMSRYRRLKIEGGAFFYALADRGSDLSGRVLINSAQCPLCSDCVAKVVLH